MISSQLSFAGFYICFITFHYENNMNIYHSSIWLQSNPILHSKICLTGPVIDYHFGFDEPDLGIHSLYFDFVICPVIFYDETRENIPLQNVILLRSNTPLQTPLQDSIPLNTQCPAFVTGSNGIYAAITLEPYKIA